MSYTMIGAIFHILGIYLSKQFGLATICAVSIFIMLAHGVVSLFKKRTNVAVFVAFFMLIVGGISYNLAARNTLYEKFPDKYVTVSGTIISNPTKSFDQFKYILEPDKVSYLGTTVKTNQRIFVRTKDEFDYGDMVEISGFLTQLTGGNNQYEYDYTQSFKSRGIYNQITAFEAAKTGKNTSLVLLLGKLKNIIYKGIAKSYPEDIAGIYTAIILGEKDHISNALSAKLLRTGVWQALYSPYIHLTFLLFLVCIFRSQKGRSSATLSLILVYALFNIGKPNVMKASLLLLSITLFRRVFGYSDKMQQLSLLVLVMTLINPMLCYHRGFVLSVSSTVILVVFYPTVNSIVGRIFKGKHRKVTRVISVGITLCLCTFPLSAYLFNGTATYSTVITTMLIPVIILIILVSVVHIPLLCSIGATGFTQDVILRLLNVIKDLPDVVEKIPFHYISSPTPSVLAVITAYLLLFAIARLIDNRKWDDISKALTAASLGFIICIATDAYTNGLEIYFVNVGQGDSAILHTSGETVLIDGGGVAEYMKEQDDYNVGDQVLVPYLISHGFSEIDYAVISHFHNDHAEGVISAVKHLNVKNIIIPDSSHGSELRNEIESVARSKNIPIIYAEKGDMIMLPSGVRMDVIAPDHIQKNSSDPNDTSVVLKVSYGDFVGLFTGDTTCSAEDGFPKYVDILKVAHHGSEKDNNATDIRYICPDYAVISVGENNTYGHPGKSVIDSLEGVNAHILRTDKLGDIRFKVRKNGRITYETYREEE